MNFEQFRPKMTMLADKLTNEFYTSRGKFQIKVNLTDELVGKLDNHICQEFGIFVTNALRGYVIFEQNFQHRLC